MNLLLKYLVAIMAVAFYMPAAVLAADGSASVDSTAFYAAVAGSVVPALTYVINHYAPWLKEPTKALIFALVAAATGAVTSLIDNGDFALDTKHLKIVGVAVFFAFVSHMGFWKPSTLSTKLGGGSNSRRSRHH